jgi:hypothetical protein
MENKIIWISGPYAGSVHDLVMARGHLVPYLNEKKLFLLADKGYIGENCFITPVRNPKPIADIDQNILIGSVRQSIERMNKRLKVFNCLKNIWRGSFERHGLVFDVICNIMNIITEFQPL